MTPMDGEQSAESGFGNGNGQFGDNVEVPTSRVFFTPRY